MAHRAHQGDQFTMAEHRCHHRNVKQVAGTQPGVVGDQHIAGLQGVCRVSRQQGLNRARQGQVEHGHGAR